jgi:predicted RNA methylase
MLELADTTSTDHVYDLGAGDGRIAITAAKQFGARSVGVEYDAELARLARCLVIERITYNLTKSLRNRSEIQ